jgi:hypothetical protein
MARPAVHLLTLVGIITFIAGFGVGFLLKREPEALEKVSRREETRATAASPIATPAARAPSDETGTALQKTVEVQKERIRELETRLVEAERKAGGVKTRVEKLAVAKEVYDAFVRLSKGAGDSEETLKLMGRLSELDADMASFFIERYKEGQGKKEQEGMALFLALASGGPDVGALILGLLTDPATSAADRQGLLQQVGGNGGFYSMNRIPVGDELAQVAYRLAGSTDVAERLGGAGLLGGLDAVQSRGVLHQIILNDADFGVRTSALRSLGYVGDRATLQLLENSLLPAAPAATPENAARTWQHTAMSQALEAAKERLKKRFPP